MSIKMDDICKTKKNTFGNVTHLSNLPQSVNSLVSYKLSVHGSSKEMKMDARCASSYISENINSSTTFTLLAMQGTKHPQLLMFFAWLSQQQQAAPNITMAVPNALQPGNLGGQLTRHMVID
jgi:hypothetical protein